VLTFRLFVVHCLPSGIRLERTAGLFEPFGKQAAPIHADAIVSATATRRVRMGIVLL
jgi:hypothetical protein